MENMETPLKKCWFYIGFMASCIIHGTGMLSLLIDWKLTNKIRKLMGKLGILPDKLIKNGFQWWYPRWNHFSGTSKHAMFAGGCSLVHKDLTEPLVNTLWLKWRSSHLSGQISKQNGNKVVHWLVEWYWLVANFPILCLCRCPQMNNCLTTVLHLTSETFQRISRFPKKKKKEEML